MDFISSSGEENLAATGVKYGFKRFNCTLVVGEYELYNLVTFRDVEIGNVVNALSEELSRS